MTKAEKQATVDRLRWRPSADNARKRVYLDVDGVLMPLLSSEELSVTMNSSVAVTTFKKTVAWDSEVEELEQHQFYFDRAVVERVAALAARDDVDFIWLTSWRENAPLALDEALGIRSSGFLDWQRKMADYNQAFKGVAIHEEQDEFPSRFVWVDDMANRRIYAEEGHPYFSPEEDEEDDDSYTSQWVDVEDEEDEKLAELDPASYLTVTTKSRVGLTLAELDRIEEFLNQ